MPSRDIPLLENGTATGPWKQWGGGQGLFTVDATFNAATIKLQFRDVNGTTFDAGSDTTLTSKGAGLFRLPLTEIRVQITGSPTGVYSYAQKFGV